MNKSITLYPCFAHLLKYENIFFYSDPHFSDEDSYRLRFPEEFDVDNLTDVSEETKRTANKVTVEHLDKMQIDNINKVCGKNSVLIILGDVGNVECIKKLKAEYKVLIMGNHDAGASNYKRKYLIYDEQGNLTDDLSNYTHRAQMESYYKSGGTYGGLKFTLDDNKLFDEVYEGVMSLSSKIMLSHEPCYSDYALNIHGHVHDKNFKSITEDNKLIPSCEEVIDGQLDGSEIKRNLYSLNCCAESINYIPIALSEIVKQGLLKGVANIHRETIYTATKNKRV